MKSKIALATTLFMLGGFVSGAWAEDNLSVKDKLQKTAEHIQSEKAAGKLTEKKAAALEKEKNQLQSDIAKAEAKSNGTLTKGDTTKFCNKVSALDHKVGREANPKRTADVKSLATVRKAIVNDKDLSSHAKNVKISFEDGSLVLDGQVDSEQEKDRLVNVVKGTGVGTLTEKLTVGK